jgi:hypothetical protein
MTNDKHSSTSYETEKSLRVKTSIWFLGNIFWVLGVADKSLTALINGSLPGLNLLQISTAIFFLIGWSFLKPKWNPAK